MTGGVIQLIAKGKEDICLTGNPQISFFKSIHRRYTNYAIENRILVFDGKIDFDNIISCDISKYGDLLHKMFLAIDFKITYKCVESGSEIKAKENDNTLDTRIYSENTHLGHSLIRSANIMIGENEIDNHSGEWLQIINELNNDKYATVNTLFTGNNKTPIIFSPVKSMVGDIGTTINVDENSSKGDTSSETYRFYIPLYFWFCRDSGLALPLIALQHQDVKLNIELENINNIKQNPDFGKVGDDPYIEIQSKEIDMKLCVDYIFLDKDERKIFAANSHEYLIEQLQISNDNNLIGNSDNKVELYFNHPIKELVWVSTSKDFSTSPCDFVSLSNGRKNDAEVSLLLNGIDRFIPEKMSYFTKVQPYLYHNNIPSQNTIGVYSFCLDPKNPKPTGTCNFSRLDSVIFKINFQNQDNINDEKNIKNMVGDKITIPYSQSKYTGKLKIFAINYNVLRIKSGVAGLAYYS